MFKRIILFLITFLIANWLQAQKVAEQPRDEDLKRMTRLVKPSEATWVDSNYVKYPVYSRGETMYIITKEPKGWKLQPVNEGQSSIRRF